MDHTHSTKISKIASYFDQHKLLIFFVPFIIYMANGREISSGDPTSTVFVAVNLTLQGTFYLDDLHDYIPYNKTPYFISEQKGRIVSNYPIFPAVMATPIFAPFTWIGMIDKEGGDLVWKYLSKLSGAVYTALSVLIMFLTLKRLIDLEGAWLLSMVYGLGTALWPIASQSLWQHGPGLFWWTTAFYFSIKAVELTDEKGCQKWIIFAGIAAGCAVLCRTTNGIGAAILSLAFLYHFRFRGLSFGIITSLAVALLMSYNLAVFNSWKGGDIVLHSLHWELDRIAGGSWSTPFWIGFPGQFISPSRGLLIFSPFLLFSFFGMISIWKEKSKSWRFIAWTIPAPLLMLIIFGKYAVWWGGSSHYGPRYQIETFPFLILYLAAFWPRISLSRPMKTVFFIFVAYSIFVQWIGAFCYPGGWTVEPTPISFDKARLWDWGYNQIWTCLKSGIKFPF